MCVHIYIFFHKFCKLCIFSFCRHVVDYKHAVEYEHVVEPNVVEYEHVVEYEQAS